MEYNLACIGETIKQERKKKKWNQQQFVVELKYNDSVTRALGKKEGDGVSIGRNTLSAIENGDLSPITIDFLLACCALFNCDLGHLLGGYNQRTLEIAEMCSMTGLTEDAIDTLLNDHFVLSEQQAKNGVIYQGYSRASDAEVRSGLSMLLSHPQFYMICFLLNKLTQSIPNDLSNKSIPYPYTLKRDDGTFAVEADRGGLKQLENNAAMEIQMEILKRFPNEAGKVGFLYGSQFADFQLRTVVELFQKLIESISGVGEYIDRAWVITEGRKSK